jgi:hypothetical protein
MSQTDSVQHASTRRALINTVAVPRSPLQHLLRPRRTLTPNGPAKLAKHLFNVPLHILSAIANFVSHTAKQQTMPR